MCSFNSIHCISSLTYFPSLSPQLPLTMYFSTMYDYQSSSSTSTSGITTPVDGVSPLRIAFPRHRPLSTGFTSSGSSSSLDKSRTLRLSFSRSPQGLGTRTVKLSLDSTKAKPIPAAPCAPNDHSPLGAFTPVDVSAERKLRSLVSNFGRIRRTTLPNNSEMITSSFSPKPKNEWAYDVDNKDNGDSEDDSEAFWPSCGDHTSRTNAAVPSITRTSAPPTAIVPITRRSPTPDSHPRSSQLRSHSISPLPSTVKRPVHVRAKTEPSSSAPLRKNIAEIHFPSRSTRSFLEPKGKNRAQTMISIPNSMAASENEVTTLSSPLAAVEHASRLRARCVCSVCGKAGVDYPRCPRCSASW